MKELDTIFDYQKSNRYFAQISSGMEKLGAEELKQLGAKNVVPAHRGIYFNGDAATLYRVNYQSRLITRVLAPLIQFTCHNEKYLYKKMKEIKWEKLFGVEHTFAIFANVSKSKITHSQYAALVAKDGIVDYFREKIGNRPDVRRQNPDVWVSVHIENNLATISWDTSGGSLHRRGYRIKTVEAPMQETVAAAMVKLSGWDCQQRFYDPFCGSGTILAEALMHAANIPASYLRGRFGFEYLPDFDKTLWEQVRNEAIRHIREIRQGLIAGSDISPEAIECSRENLKNLPFGDRVGLRVADFSSLKNLGNHVIVTNPPYGIRMGDKAHVKKMYQILGNFLKTNCQNSVAYIYFGDRNLLPLIKLKPSWRKPLRNGGLDGRLVKYEIFQQII